MFGPAALALTSPGLHFSETPKFVNLHPAMTPNTSRMQEPLLRSAGADLSAPSLAATEFDPACDSAQDAARQFHAQDAASGDFPLTPSEEPLGKS